MQIICLIYQTVELSGCINCILDWKWNPFNESIWGFSKSNHLRLFQILYYITSNYLSHKLARNLSRKISICFTRLTRKLVASSFKTTSPPVLVMTVMVNSSIHLVSRYSPIRVTFPGFRDSAYMIPSPPLQKRTTFTFLKSAAQEIEEIML